MSEKVKNGSVGASSSFPLYPTTQTSTVAAATSVSCQERHREPKALDRIELVRIATGIDLGEARCRRQFGVTAKLSHVLERS